MLRTLGLCVLALPLSGCVLSRSTHNEPLQAGQVAQLVPGTTTARQVAELLGAPSEVIQLGRRSAYLYDHTATKYTGLVMILLNVFNSDTRADRVWVFFDEHDVLSHAASSLRAGEASYALPWQKVR